MTLAHLRCVAVILAHQRCVGMILAHQRCVGMILTPISSLQAVLGLRAECVLDALFSCVCVGRSDCVFVPLFTCMWGQI